MKIIFLDIDGPLIPFRMYYHAGNRPYYDKENFSFVYDPVAVGMIKSLCQKTGAKVVFNSSHNESPKEAMQHQANFNGFGECFHADCITPFPTQTYSRMQGIEQWLRTHSETTKWCVIDDMEVHPSLQVRVNFDIGMTLENYTQAYYYLTDEKHPILQSIMGTIHGV